MAESPKQLQKYRWKKGVSANPKGRPKNILDRRAIHMNLVVPHAEDLVTKAIKMALAGNERMLDMLVSRLLPARPKEQAPLININFSSIDDYKERCNLLDASLEKGKIGLTTYKVLTEAMHKRFEGIEMHDRIQQLEQKINDKKASDIEILEIDVEEKT